MEKKNSIKFKLEQREIDTLSEFATKSRFSKGRKREEKESDLRTDFQRDRDRILHSKSFRRLNIKLRFFLHLLMIILEQDLHTLLKCLK